VLAARPSAAESVLGHATLADLLADVDRATWSYLPRTATPRLGGSPCSTSTTDRSRRSILARSALDS